MTGRLSNKVALITGAGSGIGFACARRFAEEGAAIVGFDLKPSEQWHEIESISDRALFFQGDVTSLERQQAVVAAAVVGSVHWMCWSRLQALASRPSAYGGGGCLAAGH